MDNLVYVKKYDEPEINKKEVLRYFGVKKETSETQEIYNECKKEIENKLKYNVCYSEFPISFFKDYVDLGFSKSHSKSLIKNLNGCSRIVLFGATIGIELDRLIMKYNNISCVKALMLQAIGAERIESLCDTFCNDIKKDRYTSSRFSPGYGDLPLEFQKEIFKALNPSTKIGLTLNESLIMSPLKSVTAILGISDSPCDKTYKECKGCNKKDCEFRRLK